MITKPLTVWGWCQRHRTAATHAACRFRQTHGTRAEVLKRAKDDVIRKKLRAEKKARRAALEAAGVPVEPTVSDMPTIRGHLPPPSAAAAPVAPVKTTPVAFLFPGQGSQALGMLKARHHCHFSSTEVVLLFCLTSP